MSTFKSHPREATAGALIQARWFDGIHSTPRPVLVAVLPGPRGPGLHVHPLQADVAAPPPFSHQEVDWPEQWSARTPAPRIMVGLGAAGTLEIDDAAGWHSALRAAGKPTRLTQRMQTQWQIFALVLLLSVVGLSAFYRWGTPWAATQLARFVPLEWEQTIAREAMQELDASWLRPSQLPAQRQAQLQARFNHLLSQWQRTAPTRSPALLSRYSVYSPSLKLDLRSGMPANAFALPGGQIVMTDALVRAADRSNLGDDALVGIMAHEIGHVVHRHGTRLVVEQAVLNVGLGLALGDVSSLVATASSALTSLAYRRGHEREADCFAVALMQQAQLPVAPMADLLRWIDSPAGEPGARDADPNSPNEHADSGHSKDWLSSHPDTASRAEAMKKGHGCDRAA